MALASVLVAHLFAGRAAARRFEIRRRGRAVPSSCSSGHVHLAAASIGPSACSSRVAEPAVAHMKIAPPTPRRRWSRMVAELRHAVTDADRESVAPTRSPALPARAVSLT